MKNTLITTALMAALASGAALAQSTAPSSTDPANPQAQPAQPPAAAPTGSNTAGASQAGANQAQAPSTPRIAPGSVIPVQLTKTIDAKKAKPGDPVLAKVTMDMKTNSGEVIVPKDTQVTGHVTAAQARSKDQKESQLSIAFDHATLKSGDVNLPMSIQAVIAPPSNNPNGDNSGGNTASGGGNTPAASGTTATSPMGAERSGSNAQNQPATPPPSATLTTSSDTPQTNGARPPITGSTQGVIGISNLTLQSAQNATQGSVLTSEKNNVKVESGTMLLLKVTQ